MARDIHIHFHRRNRDASPAREDLEREYNDIGKELDALQEQIAQLGRASQVTLNRKEKQRFDEEEKRLRSHETTLANRRALMRKQLGTVKDAKFTGTYTAKTKAGKAVTLKATVEAPDKYEAGDRLKKLAAKKFKEDLFYPVIKWEGGPERLVAGSTSERVAKRAGPEEDATQSVESIFREIKRKGQLEDRLEYQVEDLQQMYAISNADARKLYNLIQAESPRGAKAHDAVTRAEALAFLRRKYPDKKEKVEEYIREAEHMEGTQYWKSVFKSLAEVGSDFELYIRS